MTNKVIMTVIGGGPGYTLEDTDLWGLQCALEHGIGDSYFKDNLEWANSMLERIQKLREPVDFSLNAELGKDIFPGEKDIIRANSQHRKCSQCGHEEDIFAACAIPMRIVADGRKYNLIFGSDADFCTKCEAPWGE